MGQVGFPWFGTESGADLGKVRSSWGTLIAVVTVLKVVWSTGRCTLRGAAVSVQGDLRQRAGSAASFASAACVPVRSPSWWRCRFQGAHHRPSLQFSPLPRVSGTACLEGEEFVEHLIWSRILRLILAVFTARVLGFLGPVHRCRAGRPFPQGHGPHGQVQSCMCLEKHANDQVASEPQPPQPPLQPPQPPQPPQVVCTQARPFLCCLSVDTSS